jgi:sugar O-acyltransferase (sialic acid O-acetyltransferase NeuD family)
VQNLIIIGSSGHAKVIIDIAEKQGKYTVVGLIDRFREVGETTMNYLVLGGEADLPELLQKHAPCEVVVAIGDNFIREKVVAQVREMLPDVAFATLVHPSASIAGEVILGVGSVVMAQCAINSGTHVGCHVIINTSSAVDHDCTIADFASIAPGAILGGTVHVGHGAIVSLGAHVRHRINIGEHALVGAGSTVLSDVPASVVFYGTPAKEVRKRVAGEKYL